MSSSNCNDFKRIVSDPYNFGWAPLAWAYSED